MQHRNVLLLLLCAIACDPSPSNSTVVFRTHECPAHDDTAGDESTGATTDPTGEPPPSGLPTPTAPCPTIVDGDVTFCPGPLLECRTAVFVNVAGASGSGPLAMHWHGTYESPEGLLSWDWAAQQIRSMTDNENGVMVLPRADPDAVARPNNPFPWWVVCGETDPSECNRPDDFIFADEIVACVLEQELVSPERLTTSGMSAGGVQVSHLLDRTSGVYAGIVSWSGGLPPSYQPATPGTGASLMVLHGGPNDYYCGVGMPEGTCHDFVEPSEALALDTANAGRFAFLCDHQAGHSTAMGPEGAAFLAAANINGHPWTGYPFGYPGTGPNWMLNHYCYAPGTPSPWE